MLDRDLVARARRLHRSGVIDHHGSLQFVLFTGPVSMRPIVRTGAELFTTTVGKVAREYDVVVNGNYFDVTVAGKFDALIGHDPVESWQTIIEGRVFRAGVPQIGTSSPNRFYIAEIAEPAAGNRPGRLRYVTGFGDPPKDAKMVSALGNVGPLISGGLPYGQGNQYRPGTSGPPSGDPGAANRRNLTQRNDQTFTSVEQRGPTTGKTVIAYHARAQALLVGVQPHGQAPGQSYADIRAALIVAGFSDAVFLDGSDSSMLWYHGKCLIRPGEDKDELMTVGLAFTRHGAH